MFVILFFLVMQPLMADPPEAPDAPQVIMESSMGATKPEEFIIHMLNFDSPDGEEGASASLVKKFDNQIVLRYDYRYGWRAGDVVTNTVFYKRLNPGQKNAQWKLAFTLSGALDASSFVEDLNGDAIPDIIVKHSSSFRTFEESNEEIQLFNKDEGKYVTSGLSASSNYYSGEYNDKGTYQKLLIQPAEPLPIVVIEEKKRDENGKESHSSNSYQWSKEKKQFLPFLSTLPVQNRDKAFEN